MTFSCISSCVFAKSVRFCINEATPWAAVDKKPFDLFMVRINPSHADDTAFKDPSKFALLIRCCSKAVFVPVMASIYPLY